MTAPAGNIGISNELELELSAILALLGEPRARLDALSLYAAAADANQAIERVRAFLDRSVG
jgi:hypothetical protein